MTAMDPMDPTQTQTQPEPDAEPGAGDDAARRARAAALGRELAGLRRKVVRQCAFPGCTATFEGTVRRKFCSHRHATLYLWHTRYAARRQAQRAGRGESPPSAAAPPTDDA